MKIGVDIGGSHITVISVEGTKITASKNSKNDLKIGYSELLKIIIADINYVISKNKTKIESIGLAFPSTIDHKNKKIANSVNINIENADVVKDLQNEFKVKVDIENDANCAALAEYAYGASKGTSSSVMVTIGTGIGVGIIIDGKIFNGFNHIGSEMGHSVINFNGPKCNCGRNGCFEVYGSIRALTKTVLDEIDNYPKSNILEMVSNDKTKINGKIIFESAKQGDEFANKKVQEYVNYLAIGIANIKNSLMPEMIVIGGAASQQGKYLLDILNNYLSKYEYINKNNIDIPITKIAIAKLGNYAGAIGATLI